MRTPEHECLSTFGSLGFALSMMRFLGHKADAIALPKHLHWVIASESDITCQISPQPGRLRTMTKWYPVSSSFGHPNTAHHMGCSQGIPPAASHPLTARPILHPSVP